MNNNLPTRFAAAGRRLTRLVDVLPGVLKVLSVSALLSGSSLAAGEETFSLNYSGRLTQANGAPADGPVDIDVTFWSAATDGEQRGRGITKPGVNLINGLFTIDLPLSGPDLAAVFGNGASAVYIEITAGGKTYPRQRYMYTPLALRIPVDESHFEYSETSGKLRIKMDSGAIDGSVMTSDGRGGFTWKKIEATQLVPQNGAAGTGLSSVAPITVGGSGTVTTISIAKASGTASGYLSSGDWNTFNAKQDPLGFTPINKAGDTLGGTLNMNGKSLTGLATPTDPGDAAPKSYVDTLALRRDGSVPLSAHWNVGSKDIVNIGNIGIGSTEPSAKLDVIGQIKIQGGSPGAGKVLTSDASGLASWAAPTVGSVTSVNTGVGLSGGPVTGSGTINLADTSVTPGTYNRATVTVDQQGRLTAASSGAAIVDADIDAAANISQTKISGLGTSLAGKEPNIAGGTTSQYWRGDKTWQTLTTTAVTEGTNQYFTTARAISALSGSAPITYSTVTGTIGISQASGSDNGYLSSADWNTFNAKQNALGYTPVNKVGDTMAGALDTGGFDIANAGNIQMAASKTLALSSNTTDPAGLTAADKGKTWYNATSNQLKYWDGTAAVALGAAGSENWAAPGAIGVTTPNSAAFTSATSNAQAGYEAKPYGTAAGNTGEIRFDELAANGTNYVGFKAPDVIGADKVWVLPATDGTAGQVLKTDGAGNLGWASDGGGTVTSVSGTAPISVATGTSTPVISMTQATTTTPGYLSATDWNTFNEKQAAGNYLTSLTGDVTSTAFSSGSATATLASVTLAGTSTKVTYDVKGRVRSGTTLDPGDIPPLSATVITSGTLSTGRGGTGLSATPTNGQIPIGNGSGYTLATLSAGTGINISNTAGGVTVSATADASGKIDRSGDTMSGTLNLPANGIVVGAGQLVAANGNVGIGTATPQARLDVAGTVRASLIKSGTSLTLGGSDTTGPSSTDGGSITLGAATPGLYYPGGNVTISAGAITNSNYSAWAAAPSMVMSSANYNSGGSIDFNIGKNISGPITSSFNVKDYQGNSRLFVSGSGNVGIGTTTPAGKLDVAGSICFSGANCISSWPGGSWSTSGSNSYLASGSVGIGTSSPTADLSLGGTLSRVIQVDRNTGAGTTGGALTVQAGGAISGGTNYNGGNLTLASGLATGTGTSSINFQTAGLGGTGTADSAPTTKMTILGNGNVGIGTTNPSRFLTIQNSGSRSLNTSMLYLKQADEYGYSFNMDDFTTGRLFIKGVNGGTESNIMTLDRNSNYVGIGSSAPGAALDVVSSYNQTMAMVSSTYASATDVGFRSYANSTYWDFQINRLGSGLTTASIGNGTAGNVMSFTTTGNVGIGTTSPGYGLDVNSFGAAFGTGAGAATLYLRDVTNASWALGTGGYQLGFYNNNGGSYASKMVITNAGNVGIGTTAPAAALDINGNIAVEGATTYASGSYVFGSQAKISFPTSTFNGNGAQYATAGSLRLTAQTLSWAGPVNVPGGEIFIEGGKSPNGGILAGGIQINTNGTTRAYVDAAGNVGIGTTSPISTLTIVAPSTSSLPFWLHKPGETYAANTSSSANTYLQAGTVAEIVSLSTTVNTAALIDFNAYNSVGGATNVYLGAVAGTGDGAPANFVIGRRTGVTSWAESVRVDTNGKVGIGTTAPAAALDVRGSVKLHTDGSLFASGGVENLRIVRGSVNANGTIAAGSGFTVTRTSAGNYTVTFSVPFSAEPTVTLTTYGDSLAGFNGITLSGTVVKNSNQFGVNTADPGSNYYKDLKWEFIAIGPR